MRMMHYLEGFIQTLMNKMKYLWNQFLEILIYRDREKMKSKRERERGRETMKQREEKYMATGYRSLSLSFFLSSSRSFPIFLLTSQICSHYVKKSHSTFVVSFTFINHYFLLFLILSLSLSLCLSLSPPLSLIRSLPLLLVPFSRFHASSQKMYTTVLKPRSLLFRLK